MHILPFVRHRQAKERTDDTLAEENTDENRAKRQKEKDTVGKGVQDENVHDTDGQCKEKVKGMAYDSGLFAPALPLEYTVEEP